VASVLHRVERGVLAQRRRRIGDGVLVQRVQIDLRPLHVQHALLDHLEPLVLGVDLEVVREVPEPVAGLVGDLRTPRWASASEPRGAGGSCGG